MSRPHPRSSFGTARFTIPSASHSFPPAPSLPLQQHLEPHPFGLGLDGFLDGRFGTGLGVLHLMILP